MVTRDPGTAGTGREGRTGTAPAPRRWSPLPHLWPPRGFDTGLGLVHALRHMGSAALLRTLRTGRAQTRGRHQTGFRTCRRASRAANCSTPWRGQFLIQLRPSSVEFCSAPHHVVGKQAQGVELFWLRSTVTSVVTTRFELRHFPGAGGFSFLDRPHHAHLADAFRCRPSRWWNVHLPAVFYLVGLASHRPEVPCGSPRSA